MLLPVFPNLPEVFNGGPASVVSDAVKAQDRLLDSLFKFQHLFDFSGHIMGGGVFAKDAVCLNPAPVRGFPDHGALRDLSVFLHGRPHPDVIRHAGKAQELRRHGVMTKGIHIVANGGDLSEFLPEIPLGVQRLP